MSEADDAARRRRRKLLDKLGDVSGRIERLLAGQTITLSDVPLPQEADPGETPLERLRRFKGVLQATLDGLARGGTPRCVKCGRPIPDAALDELPWADSCGC